MNFDDPKATMKKGMQPSDVIPEDTAERFDTSDDNSRNILGESAKQPAATNHYMNDMMSSNDHRSSPANNLRNSHYTEMMDMPSQQ